MKCDHKLFAAAHSAAYMCKSVAPVCGKTMDFINFYDFYLCDIGGMLIPLLLIYFFIIFLIFKYTAHIVDEGIVEGIE